MMRPHISSPVFRLPCNSCPRTADPHKFCSATGCRLHTLQNNLTNRPMQSTLHPLGTGVRYIFWIPLSVLYTFLHRVEANCILECDSVCRHHKLPNNSPIHSRSSTSHQLDRKRRYKTRFHPLVHRILFLYNMDLCMYGNGFWFHNHKTRCIHSTASIHSTHRQLDTLLESNLLFLCSLLNNSVPRGMVQDRNVFDTWFHWRRIRSIQTKWTILARYHPLGTLSLYMAYTQCRYRDTPGHQNLAEGGYRHACACEFRSHT